MKGIKLLLVGVVSISLAGCKGEMDAIEKELKKVEVVESQKVDVRKNSTVNIATKAKEIVDNKHMKVTFMRIQKMTNDASGYEYYEITFEIENKRKSTITVIGSELSSNGKMINDNFLQMSQDISSGKKADTILSIRNYEGGPLPALDNDLEMTLYIADKKSFDWSEEYKIDVKF